MTGLPTVGEGSAPFCCNPANIADPCPRGLPEIFEEAHKGQHHE